MFLILDIYNEFLCLLVLVFLSSFFLCSCMLVLVIHLLLTGRTFGLLVLFLK